MRVIVGGLLLFPCLAFADFEVYFLRHGETNWNRERRLQGSVADTALTSEGVGMAEATARGMAKAGVTFDRIYTSPYRRAADTAAIIAGRFGLAPVEEPRIREMCFGRYEGMTYGKGNWPDDNLRRFFEDPETYVPTGAGAESFPQVQGRIRDFLERELRPLDGKVTRVLCVAHSLVLKSLVRELAGDGAPSAAKATLQRNCCVHVARYAGGKFTLRETGRIFYDPEPNARFGILSDTHVTTDDPARIDALRKALRYFDSRKVDGVVVSGDLTQNGSIPELRKIAEVWYETFPGDRRSDGEHVEKLFAYGDHDTERFTSEAEWMKAWERAKPDEVARMRKIDIACNDRAKQWELAFRERFAPITRKRVKGYDFVLAHLVNLDEPGMRYAEPLHIPGLEEFFATNAFDAARPFFYVQHKIPKGTAGGPAITGQDSGRTTAILSRHPNAVAFCGHKHRCAMDERSLWQGAFTAVEVPGLWTLLTPGGHENGRCSCDSPKSRPPFQMPQIDTVPDGKQGLVMSIYDDRIVFERRDFFFGEEFDEPWVVPWPNDGGAAFEARGKRARVPRFAPGAKVAARTLRGKDREGTPTDQIEVSFPAARSTASTPRAFDYEVRVVLTKSYVTRIAMTKRVFSPKRHWPEAHDTNAVTCVFAKSEIPSNHDSVVFEVRPLNGFGAAGEPIASEPAAYDPTRPLYPF